MTESELIDLIDKAISLKTETDSLEFKKEKMECQKVCMIRSRVFPILLVESFFLE